MRGDRWVVSVWVAVWMIGFAPLTAQAGTITGKIQFEGEVPVPKPVNFGAEKQCAMIHGDHPPMVEDLVVNPNKTVRWVFVQVKDAAPSREVPTDSLEIDQKGCVFVPHVAVARVGQKVIFKNSDTVLHNVRTESKTNKAFNIAQPVQGMTTTKVFAEKETAIKMRCDVHFWMASYLHVLDHPFFAVSGEDGTYVIRDLPAGTYTLEIWHEKLGVQSVPVTVTADGTQNVDFTLKAS